MNPNQKSFYISWGVCLAFCLGGLGFILAGLTQYGLSLFCVLPIALGIASGMLPNRRSTLYGLAVAVLSFILILLVTGQEGFICVLMALPIVAIFVLIGYFIGKVIKRPSKDNNTKTIQISVIAPFFVVYSK